MALAFKAGCSLLLSFHFHCECFPEFTVNSNGISFVREAAFYHFSPRWSRGVSTWHFPNWRLGPTRFALTSPVSLAFPQRSPVGSGGVAAPHLSRSLSLDQSKTLLISLRLRLAGCHIHSRLASASQWLRASYLCRCDRLFWNDWCVASTCPAFVYVSRSSNSASRST
jgi:hypothetical protein